MFSRFGGWGAPPVQAHEIGRPLVLSETAVPSHFLTALAPRLGAVSCRVAGVDLPQSAAATAKLLARLKPPSILALGALGAAAPALHDLEAPLFWINAREPELAGFGARLITLRDPARAAQLPTAVVTGDPLLLLEDDPQPPDPAFCERFKEVRERDRWILYFAVTAEGEEDEIAYPVFLRLSRRGVGLLALAPGDPERYETVYRGAMRFHLMTNRHGRLMTSFVPHKTRVYYIEDVTARRAMYSCADLVVFGGAFGKTHGQPLLSDLRYALESGRTVVVGPERDDDALLKAARTDGVVVPAADVPALEARLESLLAAPELRERQGRRARAWMTQQKGALDRVLALLADAMP